VVRETISLVVFSFLFFVFHCDCCCFVVLERGVWGRGTKGGVGDGMDVLGVFDMDVGDAWGVDGVFWSGGGRCMAGSM